MTESPTKFGKVINFEGINFSGLYSSVAEKHNEQSNDTVLVSWQILSKELKSLCLDKSAKKACILKRFKKKTVDRVFHITCFMSTRSRSFSVSSLCASWDCI